MVRVLNVDQNGFVYVISKAEWSASEPSSVVVKEGPYERINFSYTETKICKNRAECLDLLRAMQLQDIRSGCSDIRANFLVGGYGTVYEGRGWHALGHWAQSNNRSVLEIAYIGRNIVGRKPKFELTSAALTLVKFGLKNGYISPAFNIGFYNVDQRYDLSDERPYQDPSTAPDYDEQFDEPYDRFRYQHAREYY